MRNRREGVAFDRVVLVLCMPKVLGKTSAQGLIPREGMPSVISADAI